MVDKIYTLVCTALLFESHVLSSEQTDQRHSIQSTRQQHLSLGAEEAAEDSAGVQGIVVTPLEL